MESPRNRSRHSARNLACQALYSLSFMNEINGESLENAFALTKEKKLSASENGVNSEKDFARSLAAGVCSRLSEIDAAIEAITGETKLKRLGKMEFVMLRLGIYEMLYCDTPPKVVIAETLAIADKYASQQFRGFLNGVLNAAMKMRGDAAGNSVARADNSS